jgi:hypothetical protein
VPNVNWMTITIALIVVLACGAGALARGPGGSKAKIPPNGVCLGIRLTAEVTLRNRVGRAIPVPDAVSPVCGSFLKVPIGTTMLIRLRVEP